MTHSKKALAVITKASSLCHQNAGYQGSADLIVVNKGGCAIENNKWRRSHQESKKLTNSDNCSVKCKMGEFNTSHIYQYSYVVVANEMKGICQEVIGV